MSLARLVYYSALTAGWAAFAGWLAVEWMFFPFDSSRVMGKDTLVAGIIGAAIGLAINVVAGMANAQWKQLVLRAVPGLLGGALGGALGGFVGDLLFSWGLPRVIGWLVVGLAIGVVEGLYERSSSKIRNGLIGGGLGGLAGGLLFDLIAGMMPAGSGMSSRATGFVILGLCIGAFIGLAKVIFRSAWLTVLDGYRSGRQLILSQPVTFLGRAEHLPLPFLGEMNQDVDLEHVKISRQGNGSYMVEDNHSNLGTRLNNQPLQKPAALKNGDVIKFGTNFVRFSERHHHEGEEVALTPVQVPMRLAPPPPPPPKRRGAAAATATTGSATAATSTAGPPAPPPLPAAPAASSPPPLPAASSSGGGKPPPPPPPRRKA